MRLWQMSVQGAVLIVVVVILRAAAIHRLPKKTFIILWELALLRLLVPFSIPSAFSFYTWIPTICGTEAGMWIKAIWQGWTEGSQGQTVSQEWIEGPQGQTALQGQTAASQMQVLAEDMSAAVPWLVVWGAGMMFFALLFAVLYLRSLRVFQTAIPVKNAWIDQWKKEHPLKRPLSIRQSDQIAAPLTYGLFRPVILMPSKTDWERVDLCVHWFNPFVWVMYILFNRDMELSCDETVIRRSGEEAKALYTRQVFLRPPLRQPISSGRPLLTKIVSIWKITRPIRISG